MWVKREMLVRRDDLPQTAINDTLAPKPGEVLLEVEAFAVTANTITYAVIGETMRYWNVFLSAQGWGIVPVWGHARVVVSQHTVIAVGERVYGYVQIAMHLLVTPGKVSPTQFRDMVEHRQPISAVYNQYQRLAADLAHDAAREDARMLFEPLFLTNFPLAETLRGYALRTGTIVLTSASSKTALGTACALRVTSPNVRRIGLTSAGNVAFVERSGLYDAALNYDALDPLEAESAATLIDFAGDAAVLTAIYGCLPGRVVQAYLVLRIRCRDCVDRPDRAGRPRCHGRRTVARLRDRGEGADHGRARQRPRSSAARVAQAGRRQGAAGRRAHPAL